MRAYPWDVVLFDLDGTLLDTTGIIVESFRHACLEVLGREIPVGRFMALFGQPLEAQMRVLAPEAAEAMVRSYREYNRAHHKRLVRAFPGVPEALAELLQRGYRLGLVTSKSREFADLGLEIAGLAEYLDIRVYEEDTERHKPNPDPVVKAVALAGAAPERTLYVGDSPFDVQCGRGAGVKTALVGWTTFGEEQLLGVEADFRVEKPASLLEICPPPKGEAVRAG